MRLNFHIRSKYKTDYRVILLYLLKEIGLFDDAYGAFSAKKNSMTVLFDLFISFMTLLILRSWITVVIQMRASSANTIPMFWRSQTIWDFLFTSLYERKRSTSCK